MDSTHEIQTPQSSTPSPYEPKRPLKHHEWSPGHIYRPPNAFILFRSDLLQKGVIPADVESERRNLSQIAAVCWKRMTDAEKDVWRALSQLKREEHMRAYQTEQANRVEPSTRAIHSPNNRTTSELAEEQRKSDRRGEDAADTL